MRVSPSAAPPPAPEVDRRQLAELTARQREIFAERTPRSGETYERARQVMPKGVPSSFQENDPWPVYVERGSGAQVWDVDGNEYIDFHNGFGVMCVGHANPRIADAVKRQVDQGTHFAAPTGHSIRVAEELRRRFGLPLWRFTNSGTESTMDAVHVARGATGRDMILKIEGSYHGHHDAVMVSVYPPLEALGERDDPVSVPYGAGYPRAITELTRSVPFNDAVALARVLDRLEGQVAALIMEPAMMYINIVPPREGYLGSAAAAYRRLQGAAGRVTPARVAAVPERRLRAAGLTRQKAAYCRELAVAVRDGKLDLRELGRLSDDEVRSVLIRLPGIGPWTADIYLLMALRRPDVWPRGDLALARALQRVKRLRRTPGMDAMTRIARTWAPWRAVAARVLWHFYLSAGRPTA